MCCGIKGFLKMVTFDGDVGIVYYDQRLSSIMTSLRLLL